MSDCTSIEIDGEGSVGPAQVRERLPVANLLALATAAFITILTEALPAGLLPMMSVDLRVPDALIGQLVTVYALGAQLFSNDAQRSNATPDYKDEYASQVDTLAPAAPTTYKSSSRRLFLF